MGEGGWSALEVIIVLILVIALLGRIFGTGNNSTTDTVSKPKEEKVAPVTRTCGKLFVKTPVSLQKISVTSSGVPVEASIDSCSFDGLTVSGSYLITVVDSAATPVADPVEVQVHSNGVTYGFSHFVQFVAPPKKGTGYIIITRTSNSGSGQSNDGARIPVRFVN